MENVQGSQPAEVLSTEVETKPHERFPVEEFVKAGDPDSWDTVFRGFHGTQMPVQYTMSKLSGDLTYTSAGPYIQPGNTMRDVSFAPSDGEAGNYVAARILNGTFCGFSVGGFGYAVPKNGMSVDSSWPEPRNCKMGWNTAVDPKALGPTQSVDPTSKVRGFIDSILTDTDIEDETARPNVVSLVLSSDRESEVLLATVVNETTFFKDPPNRNTWVSRGMNDTNKLHLINTDHLHCYLNDSPCTSDDWSRSQCLEFGLAVDWAKELTYLAPSTPEGAGDQASNEALARTLSVIMVKWEKDQETTEVSEGRYSAPVTITTLETPEGGWRYVKEGPRLPHQDE